MSIARQFGGESRLVETLIDKAGYMNDRPTSPSIKVILVDREKGLLDRNIHKDPALCGQFGKME